MVVRKASLFIGVVASCVLSGAAFWCTAGIWIVKSATIWKLRMWKEALYRGQVMQALLSIGFLKSIDGVDRGAAALSRCARVCCLSDFY